MITKQYEQKMEGLGAFEVSKAMLDFAKKNEKSLSFLNAGRGNPNWIHTVARRAFAKLLEIGVKESERTMHEGDLAGWIDPEGIEDRVKAELSPNCHVCQFIDKALTFCSTQLGLTRKDVLLEWLNGIVGNNYPVPSRSLVNGEVIINAYLEKALYKGVPLAKDTTLCMVEGGTAAIVYIFDSLHHNGLLKEGDRIAINKPIFTPYIQIPTLHRYEMVEVDVMATEDTNWEIPAEEIQKLYDPTIKAFFLVNPSNPGSHALTPNSLQSLKKVVETRKDLIIITDDVYGTFVDDFQSVYAVAPHNTMLVYSFSKLFGCTGWRLGVVAMHKDNIFDQLLANLPAAEKEVLDADYRLVTLEPEKMVMIDRLCADSRSIGLYHTSGLSTPQQCMMALLALGHLMTTGDDPYFESAKTIVRNRYHALYEALGIKEDDAAYNAKYYTIIDVYHIAEQKYGADFRKYFENNYEQIDFLMRLAEEEGVVLMEGRGFDAPKGTLRVSQANLLDSAYVAIANRILELLQEYYSAYQKETHK